MNRMMFGILVLVVGAVSATHVFGHGHDFTEGQVAAVGKHCVHGFSISEQTVVFYAGDTARLNDDLSRFLEGQYATRRVVIHSGTKKVESPWDMDLGIQRQTLADWSVNTWDDPADAAKASPRIHMQIDIWLGRKTKLDDLCIPKGFEVVSGGEIEKFVQGRKPAAK